jgi:hypothetical protein
MRGSYLPNKKIIVQSNIYKFYFLYFHLCSLVSLTIMHVSHVLIKYDTWLRDTHPIWWLSHDGSN